MTQQKRANRQIRIIGGIYKGRKLRFAGDEHLRPTLGRTRETLFNWLRPYINDTRCCDVFAGSGALGIEAISQGAAFVDLLERNPKTCRALAACVNELGAQQQINIVKTDSLNFLRHRHEPYDIVFVDPPFQQPQLLDDVLNLLRQKQLVRKFVYAEAPNKQRLHEAAAGAGWQIIKQTRSGDTVSALLELDESAPNELEPGDA